MPHPVRSCLSLAVATALICSGSLLVSVNAYAADNNEIRDFTRQALFIPDASVSFRQIDDDWNEHNKRYKHERNHHDYDDDWDDDDDDWDDDDWDDDDDDWDDDDWEEDDDWDDNQRYRGRYGDSDDLSDDLEDDEPWDDDQSDYPTLVRSAFMYY